MSDSVKSTPPLPYSKGWRAPWRKQWGPMADGHSKLARLAKKIEREYLASYEVETDADKRRVRRAAVLTALSVMTEQTLGSDPKSTRRTLTALERTAEARLSGLVKRNGHEPSLSDLMVELHGGTP